jgi:acetyl esterase/lipase
VSSAAKANQLKFWYRQAGVSYFIDEVSVVRSYDVNLVVSLENGKGIVADNLGAVTLWENQIEGYGDATQSDANLGAEESKETYPGKTTVLFNKEGSFLELEGSNTHISDNNYSVFYVGKANPNGKPASLIGNYDITGSLANCKGIRFLKGSDGSIFFDYAKPNYIRTTLSKIEGNGFFFFGFMMDSSGNYSYFDSSSSAIKTGKIEGIMVPNTEDMNLNLLEEINGTGTYAQTEVVEAAIYNAKLEVNKFQDEYNRLALEYAALVKAEFTVTDVLPTNRRGISATSDIVINFSENLDDTSQYPKIFINRSTTEAAGTWNLSPGNTLTFSPTENWPANALVTLQIQEGIKSIDNASFIGDVTYKFVVASEKIFAYTDKELDNPIASVDFPIVGHKLPLRLTTPIIDGNTTEKFPVHFWVHGGGWYGGTPETSLASPASPHRKYLAENLGIATLTISYRCRGSNGTFSLAREDVQTAYDWAVANADTYNFDMSKVFFSGGSAGTPLAAIAADENDALGFIGFNGIYDFVNDAGDYGTGNGYKQNVPSEQANSPISLLSDNPPATILMHGNADTIISHQQSILFTDAITAKGGDGTTIIYPGERHGFFNGGKAYEDILIEMVGFISRTLNQQTLSTNPLITAVSESKLEDLILINNPGENYVSIKGLHPISTSFKIYNMSGQEILNKKVTVNNNLFALEISSFSTGIYILTIEQQGERINKKFIKN